MRTSDQPDRRHLMAVNGKFEGIALENLYVVGELNDRPGYRRIVRELRCGSELDEETIKSIETESSSSLPASFFTRQRHSPPARAGWPTRPGL